ncbi:unnamed protein product [Calicophoron daubneyi]|uniref:EFHB C-terminal EF-hand domain-containing protein n=1 Tax=Calicophoron daubneyi TaxID=300641 RepID=A0AAV2SYZ0_CALDB
MVLFEELKYQIPSTERKFCQGAKYIDRFCNVRPAGERGICDKVNVKACLEFPKQPPPPEVVQKMNAWTEPEVGRRRIFYGIANDPDIKIAEDIYHGVQSKDRTEIRDVIRPKEPNAMKALSIKTREDIYDSNKKKPLGTAPIPNLPEGMDPYKTMFGMPYKKDGGAGPLINPPKRRAELLLEEAADRNYYINSHKHLISGEQGRRKYEGFDPNKTYGAPTHSDPRGIHVRRALNWFSNELAAKHTPVMSQRQFDYKERFDYKLGRARDPIKDTMKVPEDHTFGVTNPADALTVAQLLHGRIPRQIAGLPFDNVPPEMALKQENCISSKARAHYLMPVIHHALRNAPFWRGSEITAVLCNRAKGADIIPMIEAREIYTHFGVPLDEELTELLFDVVKVEAPESMVKEMKEWCGSRKPNNVVIEKTFDIADKIDWAVDWRLLADFLDWNRVREGVEGEKLKECGCAADAASKTNRNEVAEAVRRRLRRAIEANIETWSTTNGEYRGDSDGLINADCWLRLGSNPHELNKPVPKVRTTMNKTDYGDETDIRAVLQPSIYGERGLSHRDLLMLRPKEEVRKIMDGSGLSKHFNDTLTFDEVWKLAVELDKKILCELASNNPADERVSLYAFKKALFQLRGEEIRKMVERDFTDRCC